MPGRPNPAVIVVLPGFIRMEEMTGIEDGTLVTTDRADNEDGDRVLYDSRLAVDPEVLVYRIGLMAVHSSQVSS
jgi:hypothetical protein